MAKCGKCGKHEDKNGKELNKAQVSTHEKTCKGEIKKNENPQPPSGNPQEKGDWGDKWALDL